MTKPALFILLASLLPSAAACNKADVIGGPLDAGSSPDLVSNGQDLPAAPGVDANDDLATGKPDAGNDSGGAVFPARVVFFYTPLGTVLDSWRPTSPAKGEFSLTGILQPLAPFKDRLLIVDGIDNVVRPGVSSSADQNGAALLLTAKAGPDPASAGGASLGAALAARLGATTAFSSLQLGVQTGSAIDFSGPDAPLAPSNNPGQTAARLFGGRPDISAPFSDTADFAAAGHQQMDLVRLAIQYDLSRVLTLSWSDVAGAPVFTWIPGVTKNYRALAAGSGTPGPDRDQFIAAQTWFAQQFAYLVGSLASTPEGNGSLLDHTLLVWVSETGEASQLTGKDIPVIIAGNLYGRFRNGAYVQTGGSQANLLSTIATVAGLGLFGDPALGNDSMAALLQP
jgi:hypothetical protein